MSRKYPKAFDLLDDAQRRANMPASEMTIRERFVLAALTGMLAESGEFISADNLVMAAITYADAALKALEAGEKDNELDTG